jgi:predicted Zn-dependent peptidase
MLEEAFGGWKGDATSAPPRVPEAPQLTRREIVIVNRPAAAQSAIEIGNVGVARATADFFPLTALNTVLGGSFTSRLNQNLRETHGYSYGALSAFEMRTSAGPFLAAAAVQTDKTAEAVQEFFKEFEALLQPVQEGELRRALSFVALGFPGAFATTGGIADELEDQFVYELPDDFFSTFVARIQAVTPKEVEAAARRYIRPGTFAVVVVGDRQMIEPKLRALNLGPVRVLTVDDVLGADDTATATR